jgi:glycerol-3-phosphate acyltransferase PlsX
MIIAVDAMGGDNAPSMVVQGAIEASHEHNVEILLVGHKRAIEKALREKTDTDSVRVHHCTEMVNMDESPLKAVRNKKDASIRVAFELVRDGQADAVVSAGHSGAVLAAGVLALGRIEGVERPAFASILPGEIGPVLLLDVGANVDCRAKHLVQFGVMGHAFATAFQHKVNPKVGLLSIGEEGGKGNEQVRMAHHMFAASHLNFVGNVEGRDILSGKVHIVVCDGFVGNVALKLSEGMAEAMPRMLRQEMSRSWVGRFGLWLGRSGFRKLTEIMDYEEYGGVPILGIKGVGVVCHGGSSARAIKNGIKAARDYADRRLQDRLAEDVNQVGSREWDKTLNRVAKYGTNDDE